MRIGLSTRVIVRFIMLWIGMETVASAQSLDVLRASIVDTTLSNGLRVVLLPRPQSSAVTIVVAYHVGSKDEPVHNMGFTHLFEHLMFQGSANVPPGKFDYYCSLAGGDNNAYTTYDKTVYFMLLPAEQLRLGLWLEADRMRALEITPEKLQTQINVVLQEIKENVENRPFGKFGETSAKLAYRAGCPYSWDPYGDPEHIRNASMEEVLRFHDTFYGPNNACLVITGNIDPSTTLQEVERYFGDIQSKAEPEHPDFSPECRQVNQYTQIYDNIATDAVFLQFHCPGFRDSTLYAGELLAAILADGLSSRLVKTLRYEQQLVSEVGAYIDDRELSSLFTIYAIARDTTTTAQQLVDAIWEQLEHLLQTGIEERELVKAKNQLRTAMLSRFENLHAIAEMLAHYALFFNDPTKCFELPSRIQEIQKADVERFARTVLRKDQQIRIDFLPKTQADAHQ